MRINSPKVTIYLIVAVALIASSAFYFYTKTSLTESLFVSALGMAITIFLIDSLLATDKKYRYESLNKHIAENLRFTIGLYFIKVRKLLGDKQDYKIDELEKATDELASLFEKDLDMLVRNTSDKNLVKFCDSISECGKSIEKVLPEIVPFSSTELRKLVSNLSILPISLKELLKLHTRTSTITMSAKPNKFEQQILSDIDNLLIKENKKIIYEIKSALLKIHELASKDALQEII